MTKLQAVRKAIEVFEDMRSSARRSIARVRENERPGNRKLCSEMIVQLQGRIREAEETLDQLRDIAQGLQSEPVRRALAAWQIELMEAERGHTEGNLPDYPKERGIPCRDDPVLHAAEVVDQPVGGGEDAEPGEGGGSGAEDRRNRDAVQSDCGTAEGSLMEPELEGGGMTWFYVCPECHGYVDPLENPCRHCGQGLRWK